jgi:hypothetical protein
VNSLSKVVGQALHSLSDLGLWISGIKQGDMGSDDFLLFLQTVFLTHRIIEEKTDT